MSDVNRDEPFGGREGQVEGGHKGGKKSMDQAREVAKEIGGDLNPADIKLAGGEKKVREQDMSADEIKKIAQEKRSLGGQHSHGGQGSRSSDE